MTTTHSTRFRSHFRSLCQPRALRSLAAAALAFAGATSWAGTVNVFTSDAAGFNTHSVWYDDGRGCVETLKKHAGQPRPAALSRIFHQLC